MDRGVATGVSVGVLAPRNLADRLTLFKPGGRLCPSHYVLPAPQIQKAIYTSEWMAVRVLVQCSVG